MTHIFSYSIDEMLAAIESLFVYKANTKNREEECSMSDAIDIAIKTLEQETNTWSLDDAREDFTHDVYNTLDFLPTNNEANRIIDIFDRVTSSIKQEPVLDKIRAEIEQLKIHKAQFITTDKKVCIDSQEVLDILDKYKKESEG